VAPDRPAAPLPRAHRTERTLSPFLADLAVDPAIALLAVVAFAFFVETSLGFGATLLSVTLGAALLPIPQLLPALVPLNLFISLWILSRAHSAVHRRLLLRWILPWMGLGIPAGIALFLFAGADGLARILGGCVALLAARELLPCDPAARPVPHPAVQRTVLLLGGVMHGAFGSGGPFVVYVLGRQGLDKEAFRATLAALWVCLNLVLLVTWLATGAFPADTLSRSAWLAGGALIGMVAGQALFVRLPAAAFRRLVFGLLLLAGLALLVR
jgi:uncharacterized membrane protein YfcA